MSDKCAECTKTEKSNEDNSGCSMTIGGVSVGSAVAAGVSWYVNHSIGYAIVHFFLSWFYILYALLAHSDKLFAAVP